MYTYTYIHLHIHARMHTQNEWHILKGLPGGAALPTRTWYDDDEDDDDDDA